MKPSEFERDLLNSDRPAVVDFSAGWCGPCQALSPEIERLAAEYSGRVDISKVDVDENQELAGHYGVQSVPTVLFFREGKEVARVTGNAPDRIRAGVESLLR